MTSDKSHLLQGDKQASIERLKLELNLVSISGIFYNQLRISTLNIFFFFELVCVFFENRASDCPGRMAGGAMDSLTYR